MITIRHTHEGGTLVEGSAKGDGVYEILRGLRGNWRYFPSLRQIGLGQSRDKAAKTWDIGQAAEALRAAGHEVTVEIDDGQRRSFAEAEQERYERAEDRAERLAGYAANASQRSAAAFATADKIMDMIPMGQPILVGHHSERRHRKDLERIDRGMTRGLEEAGKARHYEHRAELAENMQASREDVPATLRRIKKLEADERRLRGDLVGRPDYYQDDGGGWKCRLIKPEGDYLTRLDSELAAVRDELAYWRDVVARAEAGGVKVWSKADFTKGDFVQQRDGGTWYEVVRVSAKSVSVPARVLGANRQVWALADERRGQPEGSRPWTDTVPYDTVHARKSAEEMTEFLAAAEAAS